MLPLASKPSVSVCVITFNQQRYISDCLASLLAQKTNFKFEIIVADDCSSDGTAQIVEDFSRRFPEVVRLVLHRKKIGGTQNFISAHTEAQGEFVAHVDGDDVAYPGKLQSQYDFLKSHPSITLVWHAIEQFNGSTGERRLVHSRLEEVVDVNRITRNDLIRYGSLGAASAIMYRRAANKFISDVTGDKLDYFFAIKLLGSGSAAKMVSVLGGYRSGEGNATLSGQNNRYFISNRMRETYFLNLQQIFSEDPKTGEHVFLNALFNFLVDLRFLRPTAIKFLGLAIRTVNLKGLLSFPVYFRKAMILRSN